MGLLGSFGEYLPDFQSPGMQGLLSATFGGMAAAGKGGPFNTAGAAGLAGLLGYNKALDSSAERQQKQFLLGLAQQEMGGDPQVPMPVSKKDNSSLFPAIGGQSSAGNMSLATQPATWYGQPEQPASQPIAPQSVDPMRRIKAITFLNPTLGNAMRDNYKFEQQGTTYKQGETYVLPNGRTISIPKLGDGQSWDMNANSVSTAAGYLPSIKEITSATEEAKRKAEAKYTPLDTKYVGRDGRPIGGSVANYLGEDQPSQPKNLPLWLQARLDYANSIQDPQERQSFVNAVYNSFDGKKNADQLGQQWAGALRGGHIGMSGNYVGGRPQLQSTTESREQQGEIDTRIQATQKLNDNWITATYNPVVQAADSSRSMLASLDSLSNIDLKTGWATQAKADAANVLTSLGISPKNAEAFATDVQKFQSVAMDRLMVTLQAQKGPQTEGDAQRAMQTFAQLKNTPKANQFISAFARAKANMDVRRASFYQEALPIAKKNGDLTEIDRQWSKIQGSIWNDPALKNFKGEK